MTVTTTPEHGARSEVFAPHEVVSIRLAVAQWMRSARGVVEARDQLARLDAPAHEIFRRRRAESSDARLADVLRLAVTLTITGGRLEPSDRRRFAGLGDDVIRAVARHSAHAQARVLHLARMGPPPVIDLDVGDY